MKILITAICTFFLVACSSTAPLTSTQDSDWGTYGLERGEKGWNFESKEQITGLLDGKELMASNYDAYQAGYKTGLQEYCSQDAFELGTKGGVYTGVCDGINKEFKYEYLRGSNSTKRGM
jgi:hypothetical protein